MKYYFTILILVLFYSISFSQVQPSKTISIGSISINELVVDSLQAVFHMKVKAIIVKKSIPLYNGILDEMKDGAIYEMKEPDPKNASKIDHPAIVLNAFIDGYRIFKAKRIKVNDLELEDVSMIFYNDTLITFESNYVKLAEDILRHKYGAPSNSDTTIDSVSCKYIYTGATNKHLTASLDFKWKVDLSEADIHLKNFFTDDCKEYKIQTLRMYDISKRIKYLSLTSNKFKTYYEAEKSKKEGMLNGY